MNKAFDIVALVDVVGGGQPSEGRSIREWCADAEPLSTGLLADFARADR